MSWMHDLYHTACEVEKLTGPDKPWPVAHIAKKAHIEITISLKGELRGIRILNWDETITIIPATEESANRTNANAPHPLCEELGYCAKDLPDRDANRYEKMRELMEQWLASEFAHHKVKAVFTYLQKGTVYSDLDEKKIFPFKVVNSKGKKTTIENNKVFIRWRVDESETLCTGTWEDQSLINSWIAYDSTIKKNYGFCMLEGKQTRITKSYPRFLRTSDDGAKIISSNDNDGYTFKGRFTDKKDESGRQCCSVGYIASQKAHNVLRWLISRQGYQKTDGEFLKTFIAWAITCKDIPDISRNTLDFLDGVEELIENQFIGDIGQSFAIRLKKKMAGYKANISNADNIIVMGLDSATPGRMAITFYRKLQGSEFLERVENWHQYLAWFQNFENNIRFIGTPSPKEITLCAYGSKAEGKNGIKLMNSTIERLIPCIVDGTSLPRDIVESCVRRACNRNSFKKKKMGKIEYESAWEQCLGIACSLFKGFHKERGYCMALEEDRKTRDYLYGRLLAVGEQIESFALFLAGEHRETAAARQLQRFADRPCSTWKQIEINLKPYKARLIARVPGLKSGYDELLQKIHDLFITDEYVTDTKLSGEFLIGYHCQRKWLHEHKRENGAWVLKNPVDQKLEHSEN